MDYKNKPMAFHISLSIFIEGSHHPINQKKYKKQQIKIKIKISMNNKIKLNK